MNNFFPFNKVNFHLTAEEQQFRSDLLFELTKDYRIRNQAILLSMEAIPFAIFRK